MDNQNQNPVENQGTVETQPTATATEKKRLPTWAIVLIVLAVVFIALPISCVACTAGCVGCAACAVLDDVDLDNWDFDVISSTDIVSYTDAGTVGDYYVEISSYRLFTDTDGKPVIFVTYNYTNNSEDEQSFAMSVNTRLYQNDVQLEDGVILEESEYDSEVEWKDIAPGETISVEYPHYLIDTTTPVRVEVTNIFFENEIIVRTFDIAE